MTLETNLGTKVLVHDAKVSQSRMFAIHSVV